VSAAATVNNPSDTTPTLTDLASSAAPNLGFYAFRDFTLSEAGSGSIKYEEVAVGPDTVLCVTWDGVESAPTTLVNKSTFQWQFNLSTGNVRLACTSWDSSTSTSDAVLGMTLQGGGGPADEIDFPTMQPTIVAATGQPSLYQLFPDEPSAKAALQGNSMHLAPTATGYAAIWIPGGAASFIAPTGGATTGVFSVNGNIQVTPSLPMPTPVGLTPTLTISENGILTAATTPNNGIDTTPSAVDLTGSAAPNLGFYSWRNFEVNEAGSGPIQYEEVTVGPDTVLCITWNGVEATPSTMSNPSTWQFQVNLNSGTVDVVWPAWDPSTSTDDTLVGITLPGTATTGSDFDPFSVDLATVTPKFVTPMLQALRYQATPAPIFTIGNPSVSIDWKIDHLVDLSPIAPGAYLGLMVFSLSGPLFGTGVDMTFLGFDAPGCNLLIGGTEVVLPISPIASSHTVTFPVPQPLSPGDTFYSQIFNFILPNSLPNGLNGFAKLSSTGLKSRIDLQ
jgi:hypothetical protein